MRTQPTHARAVHAHGRHMSTTATAASVAVLVAVTVLALGSWLLGGSGGTSEGGDGGPTSLTRASHDRAASAPARRPRGSVAAQAAVDVLRAWDRARSSAWSAGDATALADLYLAGSAAGERDVARLRRWTERGLRVEHMRMQLLRVDVRTRTDRRLVLHVTDRLTGAVAVRAVDGSSFELPTDRPDTRRLEFRRTAGRWRLASAYDRPLVRIAATSGSAIS